MIETTEKVISGKIDGVAADVTYTVKQLPAMKALRVSVKLAKTLGGGLSAAAGGGMASVMEMDLGNIVKGVMENLDEEETPKLILELMQGVTRNGVVITPEVFDKVYAANFGELFSALKLVLEVNFGGFMAAVAEATGNEQPQAESEK